MGSTKFSAFAAAALAPVAMTAIGVAAAAPAVADSLAGAPAAQLVGAYSVDDPQWDGGDPAGGTGVDAGPQTAPDLAGVPEDAAIDSSEVDEAAGGTGVDAGLAAPPDTPTGPGLEDGGEPAGGIG